MRPMSFSLKRGPGPIADLQLSENVRNVILHCAFGEEECAGANLVDHRQILICGSVDHAAVGVESGAVARTIPGLL